jgi:hypothetical protein
MMMPTLLKPQSTKKCLKNYDAKDFAALETAAGTDVLKAVWKIKVASKFFS